MHSMCAPKARAIRVIFEYGWEYRLSSDTGGVIGIQTHKYQGGEFRICALKWLCRKQANKFLEWVDCEAQFLGLELKNARRGMGLLNS